MLLSRVLITYCQENSDDYFPYCSMNSSDSYTSCIGYTRVCACVCLSVWRRTLCENWISCMTYSSVSEFIVSR